MPIFAGHPGIIARTLSLALCLRSLDCAGSTFTDLSAATAVAFRCRGLWH
jgi:hypothetical protein